MPVRVLVALPDDGSLVECYDELTSCGYSVGWANSGLDCLDRLTAVAFDVIIVSADLRWGGGVGVVELLADDADRRHLPVILLDAGGTADDHPNVVACVPGRYEPGTLPPLLQRLYPTPESHT